MSLYKEIKQSSIKVSGDLVQGIRAEFNFPGELELFKGHFPGQPILPGVSQIEMVKFALEAVTGRPVSIRSIKKTKFSHLIRPGVPVSVNIHISTPGKGPETEIGIRAVVSTPEGTAGKVNLVFTC